MEATGRLRRLLYLVPAVLARQGVPVAELAKELDIDEATSRIVAPSTLLSAASVN